MVDPNTTLNYYKILVLLSVRMIIMSQRRLYVMSDDTLGLFEYLFDADGPQGVDPPRRRY